MVTLLLSGWASLLCSGLPLQAGPGCSEAVAMCLLPWPFMSDRTVVAEAQDAHGSCSCGQACWLWACVWPRRQDLGATLVLRATVIRTHTMVTPDGSWHEVEEFRPGLGE